MRSCFIFGRSRVEISARWPAVLTDISCDSSSPSRKFQDYFNWATFPYVHIPSSSLLTNHRIIQCHIILSTQNRQNKSSPRSVLRKALPTPILHRQRSTASSLTFRRRIFFFQILAHSVFKMWVIQKPNKAALWNKRHFEEKKWRLYSMFKILRTDICWINIKWGI